MRKWSIVAALTVAVCGIALATKFGRPGAVVATEEAPVSIFELTLKARDLPVQDVHGAI
jgi:hypothetical protein